LELENDIFTASGLKLHNFYGASECGGISLDLTDVPRSTADDLGTPLPGVNLSVARDGRLRVESTSVATGYDAPRADDLLEDGIYLTRDRGFIDSRGRLHLMGTVGNAINVSGRKVSPSKIEEILLATGMVVRATVHGIPSNDPERFEEISATIILSPGTCLAAVKTAAAGKLQAWELPRHWHEA
jgi:acyl-coenzyme A synthetase/AMP-(fatty) acid ligase